MNDALERDLLDVLTKHNVFGAIVAVVQELPDGWDVGGMAVVPYDTDQEDEVLQEAAVRATKNQLHRLLDSNCHK